MTSPTLFDAGAPPAPLADRMRPATLDELVGHGELVGPGGILRRLAGVPEGSNILINSLQRTEGAAELPGGGGGDQVRTARGEKVDGLPRHPEERLAVLSRERGAPLADRPHVVRADKILERCTHVLKGNRRSIHGGRSRKPSSAQSEFLPVRGMFPCSTAV